MTIIMPVRVSYITFWALHCCVHASSTTSRDDKYWPTHLLIHLDKLNFKVEAINIASLYGMNEQ